MNPRVTVAAAVWALMATSVAAHPAPFSYLDLHLSERGVEGALIVHDLDVAHEVGVERPERLLDPAVANQYRDVLTRLMSERLNLLVDGQRASITWTGLETLPERQSLRLTFAAGDARPARVRVDAQLFPYDPIHQTFINVYEDDRLRHQAIIAKGRQSADYYAGTWQGAGAVLAAFVPAGMEHILVGPDHLLFLVGLMLLGGTLGRLATIVTAFTIGHSITLSLAALDVISPPASIVEPVIALSIVVVGADNLLVQRDRTNLAATVSQGRAPRDIRPWIAGVFGLVHGMGFASVLKAFGLPLTALGWSLFSFNLGVEIGQLAIVFAVALGLRAIAKRDPAVARTLIVAGSVVVIVAGTYWFVERVFLTGRT